MRCVCLVFGLVYCYYAGLAFKTEERQGWLFRHVDSTRPLHFFPLVLHDAFAGLAFVWLAVFTQSYFYGRSITLWAAHITVTAAVITRFTDEEGRSWKWLGTPFLLLIGWYLYYLALITGVAISEVWDFVEAFLDA